MTSRYYRILFIVICTFTVHLGHAQSKEIKIEFLGNCGLYLTDGETNIYTDFPYKSGAYGYMEFEESELDRIKENAIFIFTHKHADHYSKKNLKRVMKEKGGKKYGVSNIADLEELNETLDGFEIKPFQTKHTFFGINFRHYSYLIRWHGKKIYLSGDTTNPETIGSIKDIDLAFIPYWIYENAREQNMVIDAKEMAIYHLYPSEAGPAEKFFKNKKNEYPFTQQGEIIRIELP